MLSKGKNPVISLKNNEDMVLFNCTDTSNRTPPRFATVVQTAYTRALTYIIQVVSAIQWHVFLLRRIKGNVSSGISNFGPYFLVAEGKSRRDTEVFAHGHSS